MVNSPVTQVNYTPNREIGLLEPEGVVIHWWGEPKTNPKFDNIVNHLCTPNGAASVSAHFVVEENRVAQLANLDDVTWHAMSANTFTVGIECNPRMTDGDIETVAKLIAWIWDTLGRVVPIGTHNYYVATQCPGVWEDLAGEGRLWVLAHKYYNGEEVNDVNTWDEQMTNRWGDKYAARDIFLSMDKNVVKTITDVDKAKKELQTDNALLASKLDELMQIVSKFEPEKITKIVTDSIGEALKDLEIVLKTQKGTVTTEGKALATQEDVNMVHEEIHKVASCSTLSKDIEEIKKEIVNSITPKLNHIVALNKNVV